MPDLNQLRERIFGSDNTACFIERERILAKLEKTYADYEGTDKYARILSDLLAEVSTPILDCDYFAGRVLESQPDGGMNAPNLLLISTGHMSFDYAAVLKMGLRGMLEKIQARAREKGDEESAEFARNAEIVVTAVRDFACRYGQEARRQGKERMAQALEKTPYEPAYDLYSALQGMWILHMIASCYVGSRDYAFGRFDQYLLPFYEQALKDGAREEELVELVAGFLIKTNEICGRTAHNHQCKPVLCHSSKQYVNIGGETPNAFSQVVLRAAMLSNMAQPQITVLLKPEADVEFTRLVFEAMSGLVDKLHIYHYDLVVDMLKKKGIEDAVARDFTYSACCTFDLNYHSYRLEHFIPAPQLFLQTLAEQDYASLTELTSAFREMLKNNMQKRMRDEEAIFANRKYARQIFVFDSLFLTDSAFECQYACEGRGKYVVFNMFFAGIATLGDSLMVLDRLVFREKRYTCREFVEILNQNFQGHEALRREILAYDKFGNDTEVDEYAALMGNVFLDAVDQLELRKNQYVIGGFYSLERDNTWRAEVGATPDGRLAGEPFSENQSPTYGADKAGFTALLKSLSRLPFQRTATGGLNLTFSQRMTPSILQSLVTAYFQMGGLHVGISVVDHDTLRDAMDHPEKYRSLTVRLYGFSEYFVSLPKFQQLAILHRTTYAG